MSSLLLIANPFICIGKEKREKIIIKGEWEKGEGEGKGEEGGKGRVPLAGNPS